MTFRSVPWARQPQVVSRLREPFNRPTHGFIAQPFRPAGVVSMTGSAAQGVGINGIVRQLTGSGGYLTQPGIASANSWSILAFGVLRSAGASSITTMAEAPGDSTYDRSLLIGTSGVVRAYLYDGVPRDSASSATVGVGVPFVAAAVAAGSTITAYLNGVAGTPTTVSNLGFTGYSSPEFVCGYGGGSGDGGTSVLSSQFDAAYILMFDNCTLSEGALRSIGADGWKVFEPRRIWVPQAAAGGASTMSAAAGSSTASTLTAAATAAGALSAAAGSSTTSALTGSAVAQATMSSAAGVSTASTMVGGGGTGSTMSAAAGSSTASTMTGGSIVSATMASAAGTSTVTVLAGGATTAASIAAAAGVSTTGTLVGGGLGSVMSAAAGVSTVSTMTGGAFAISVMSQAAGSSAGSVMLSNGAPGVTVGGTVRPRMALLQRTGELFPLLLDDDGIPYAYQREGGSTVNLRMLGGTSLGSASSNPAGDLLILI